MKATEQTWQQIERFLGKVTNKFPSIAEAERMTDIHVRVSDGELLAFDDDDNEITRCVVEQWIDYKISILLLSANYARVWSIIGR